MFQVHVCTARTAAKYCRDACIPPDLCCPLPLKLAGRLNASNRQRSNNLCKYNDGVHRDYSAKHVGDIIVQQMNVPEWANVIIAENGFMNFYLNDITVDEEFKRAPSSMNVDKRELTTAAAIEVSCVKLYS